MAKNVKMRTLFPCPMLGRTALQTGVVS